MSLQTAAGIVPTFTIGDRLRKARTMLGTDMDVKRFADLIAVSKNTITNYELENTDPARMKPIVLRQWAMATGVDYEWLLHGETPPTGDGVSDGVPPTGVEPATYGTNVRRFPIERTHRAGADIERAA